MEFRVSRILVLFVLSLVMISCRLNQPAKISPISPTAQIAPTLTPSPEKVAEISSTPTATLLTPTEVKATQSASPTLEPTSTPIEFTSLSKDEVFYNNELNLSGYLCTPQGVAPFPAVVFNHGGLGDVIGGAPEETCLALAEAGFVGFSPIRRQTIHLDGHIDDVQFAIDYVKNLAYVDPEIFGLMGFSRGGMLTFMVAAQRSDLQAAIIMASALPKDGDFSGYIQEINIPILIMVASNDFPAELNKNQNVVEGAQEMEAALKAAGKDVRLIIYPPYEPHGHMMFFELGEYWKDVIAFLAMHLE